MTATLPDNWRVEWECGWGTGRGDEQFGYSLYRWGNFTTGRLWWKKRRQGWIFKMWLWDVHYNRQDAIELAAKTERMLTSN